MVICYVLSDNNAVHFLLLLCFCVHEYRIDCDYIVIYDAEWWVVLSMHFISSRLRLLCTHTVDDVVSAIKSDVGRIIFENVHAYEQYVGCILL